MKEKWILLVVENEEVPPCSSRVNTMGLVQGPVFFFFCTFLNAPQMLLHGLFCSSVIRSPCSVRQRQTTFPKFPSHSDATHPSSEPFFRYNQSWPVTWGSQTPNGITADPHLGSVTHPTATLLHWRDGKVMRASQAAEMACSRPFPGEARLKYCRTRSGSSGLPL